MRQHVTPEQLAELTPEQQERLRAWWQPKEFDICLVKDWKVLPVYRDSGGKEVCFNDTPDPHWGFAPVYLPKERCLPLLSIGQCIELLKEKWGHVNIQAGDTDKELIDELFAAVKEVL